MRGVDLKGIMARRARHQMALSSIVVASLLALGYALSYEFGTFQSPGPGMWPVIGAGIMLVTSLMLLLRETSSDEYEAYTREARTVPIVLLLTIALGIALSSLGLSVPLFAFLLVWLRFIVREPWMVSVAVAIGGALAVYFAFDYLLGIPFPRDIIFSKVGL